MRILVCTKVKEICFAFVTHLRVVKNPAAIAPYSAEVEYQSAKTSRSSNLNSDS